MKDKQLRFTKSLQFTNGRDQAERVMTCPVCGFTYSHYRRRFSVPSNTGPFLYKQGIEGLIFDGECGHSWEVCFGEHKGNVYLFCVQVPSLVEVKI